MMNFEDTIAAIATPAGTGALSLLRFSGPNAVSIAKKIFRPGKFDSEKIDQLPEFKSYLATHGFIFDPDIKSAIDEVVLTAYLAPGGYTGEDLIEITCHGGQVVTAELLALLLRQGCRLANRGEFTQRAFLNGRLDLTQAEAVLDIIQARTARQGRSALSALTGGIGSRIKRIRDDLMVLLTRIVAGIDFPEEIGDAPEPEIDEVVKRNLAELKELLRTARSGHYMRQGLKLALVGRPNAGKSSLLNQLLQFERAIVTDIPGTTRDSLEELLDLNGIPIVLVDTAGIRATDDQVERIGIERTKKAVAESDLVIFLLDDTAAWGAPEDEIVQLLNEKPFLLVINKIDLGKRGSDSAKDVKEKALKTVEISALTGQNISELTRTIEEFVFEDQASKDGPSLNARQGELCTKAAQALSMMQETLAAGYPQDCLATDLKIAVDALSEVSGQSVTEEVITQVFATFCIGK